MQAIHENESVCQHIGRGSVIWRHGFQTGAVDALRLAARRLPPDMQAVLEQMADEYADADA